MLDGYLDYVFESTGLGTTLPPPRYSVDRSKAG